MTQLLADPLPITVALHFRPCDAPALWDLAARHIPDDGGLSTFAKAARATERGLPIILEATLREQVEQLASFFIAHGIEPPRVEEVSI